MKRNLLILVLALQCAWVFATIFTQERALRAGQSILLETVPVDPRDLLRGDYVILSYKISTIPAKLFVPPVTGELPPGTKVYVALGPVGEFREVRRASTAPVAAGPDEIVLQGDTASQWRGMTHSVRVHYGLERYYVAEGTGNPTGTITVQAVVPASGRPSMKQVFVDGKPFAEAMKANLR